MVESNDSRVMQFLPSLYLQAIVMVNIENDMGFFELFIIIVGVLMMVFCNKSIGVHLILSNEAFSSNNYNVLVIYVQYNYQ